MIQTEYRVQTDQRGAREHDAVQRGLAEARIQLGPTEASNRPQRW